MFSELWLKKIRLKTADCFRAKRNNKTQNSKTKPKKKSKAMNRTIIKIRSILDYGKAQGWSISLECSSHADLLAGFEISQSKGGRFLTHLSLQHGSRVESLSFDRRDRSSAGCHTDRIQTAYTLPKLPLLLWKLVSSHCQERKSSQRSRMKLTMCWLFCVCFFWHD